MSTKSARAVFADDYLREHINHGYAVTVHTAQGVTADTNHAVLGENTSRALLYVAMTRGRESNTAYLYERIAGEGEHEHTQPDGQHLLRRGTTTQAAQLVRHLIANHDQRARTAHYIAEIAHHHQLPKRVADLLHQRHKAVQTRRRTHQQHINAQTQTLLNHQHQIHQHYNHTRNHQQTRSQDHDYDLGL